MCASVFLTAVVEARTRPMIARMERTTIETVIRAAMLREPLLVPPRPPDRREFKDYMDEDIET